MRSSSTASYQSQKQSFWPAVCIVCSDRPRRWHSVPAIYTEPEKEYAVLSDSKRPSDWENRCSCLRICSTRSLMRVPDLSGKSSMTKDSLTTRSNLRNTWDTCVYESGTLTDSQADTETVPVRMWGTGLSSRCMTTAAQIPSIVIVIVISLLSHSLAKHLVHSNSISFISCYHIQLNCQPAGS